MLHQVPLPIFNSLTKLMHSHKMLDRFQLLHTKTTCIQALHCVLLLVSVAALYRCRYHDTRTVKLLNLVAESLCCVTDFATITSQHLRKFLTFAILQHNVSIFREQSHKITYTKLTIAKFKYLLPPTSPP